MIPLIWPAYAFLSGDANQWLDGVLWQATQRQSEDKALLDVIIKLFQNRSCIIDPRHNRDCLSDI